MTTRTRARAARARAEESPPIEITIAAVAGLRFCALCSCVTDHGTGRCEYQEFHEQPRSE